MLTTSNTKQALWIAIGSFTTFSFAIVSSMILSRFLSKIDYGTYKQVIYVYNTLLTIFTVGLPQAFGYFLPRVKRREGRSLVMKITYVLFAMGLLFSFILIFSAKEVSAILKNPDLIHALKIFSPVPFLLLPTMGIESIYSTYRKSHVAAIYTLITRLILLISVITPVILFGQGYEEALYGFVLASFINCIIALYLKNKPFPKSNKQKSDISYRDIFKFSLPLLFASLWGMVINSSDQFFISRYFGTEIFADFSNGAIELPFVGMIISACSTVLYPVFSKFDHEGVDPKTVIYPIWKTVFRKTALLIYPLVVFCWVFADEIMGILYGTRYESSGIYFKIKLIANIFTLVAYAPVILSIGKTSYYAKVHMYGALILVILEFISVKTIESPYSIVAISVLCQIGRIFAMLHLISCYFKVKLVNLFPIKLISSNLIEIILCGSAYIIFMLIISYFFKLDYLTIIKGIVKK